MNNKEDDPKDYILKEGDYRVSIRIWEVNDLIPKYNKKRS